MKVLDVFSAFESRFRRLSARDQAILTPDKVIMFLRAVDVWDRKDLEVASPIHGKTYGILSHDTQRGRKLWLASEEKRVSEPRSGLEDHQPWVRDTTTEKGIDATTMEQLLKEMENLKIVMVKKSDDRPTSSKYIDRRCIWCDSTDST